MTGLTGAPARRANSPTGRSAEPTDGSLEQRGPGQQHSDREETTNDERDPPAQESRSATGRLVVTTALTATASEPPTSLADEASDVTRPRRAGGLLSSRQVITPVYSPPTDTAIRQRSATRSTAAAAPTWVDVGSAAVAAVVAAISAIEASRTGRLP